VAEDDPLTPTPFRCTGCGAVAGITIRSRRYVAQLQRTRPHPMKPPAPTCPQCGGGSWVAVGSMTEYYVWTRQDDVCQVGGHRAEGTATYELVPRVAPQGLPPEGMCHLLGITVRACPDHVDALRTTGVLGCVLVDGTVTSDTE
jgi:hypothetical protein